LIFQVDSLTAVIKNFEDKCAILEEKHLSLSKDRDTTECQLKELQEFLKFKTEEHMSVLELHELHVTSLQSQISAQTSQIETLQNSIKEVSRKNTSLDRSLSDLNAEIVSLNMVLKESQELCQSLHAQRSSLICQKDDLSAQVALLLLDCMKFSSNCYLLMHPSLTFIFFFTR
jgi:chromosome segregation ATPase